MDPETFWTKFLPGVLTVLFLIWVLWYVGIDLLRCYLRRRRLICPKCKHRGSDGGGNPYCEALDRKLYEYVERCCSFERGRGRYGRIC